MYLYGAGYGDDFDDEKVPDPLCMHSKPFISGLTMRMMIMDLGLFEYAQAWDVNETLS
jgi:hypothetical protein